MGRWVDRVELGDVFHDDNVTVSHKAAVIKERMTPLDKKFESGGELLDLLDELVEVSADEDPDEFDVIWDQIYDWADANSVWIDTWGTVRA